MRRLPAWLLPLSGAFAASAFATFFSFLGGPGCQAQCFTSFDCGDGAFCQSGRCETECFVDQDCRMPPECQDNPIACKPKGLRCDATGRCVAPAIGGGGPGGEQTVVDVDTSVEGWQSPPGFGQAYIVNNLAIAGAGRGFDINGACRGPGDCIDNSLWQLGQLGNDQIRQGLVGGATLLLIELAGLDTPYVGNDRTLTVKWYAGRDADNPITSENNFESVDGDPDCCRFRINPQSLSGVPLQATARAPAKIERGQLKSLAPVTVQFTLTVGAPPYPEIRIRKTLVSARLPANTSRLDEGLIGGAVPIQTLAQTDNPYCKTLNQLCPRQLTESTLIDLVATILPPDIDLDPVPDGLERLEAGASGRIEFCYDGDRRPECGGPCTERPQVMPTDPARPYTCALRPEMADGYSVGITFSAVSARIVGSGG